MSIGSPGRPACENALIKRAACENALLIAEFNKWRSVIIAASRCLPERRRVTFYGHHRRAESAARKIREARRQLDHPRVLRRREFFSEFFKTLQARGLAPKVKRMPGLALQRITKEARAEWHKLIDELEIAELKSPSPEVKAKQDRWIEQRREAGLRGGRPRKERRPPSVRRRKSSRERRNA
jgi:hypothetical protein